MSRLDEATRQAILANTQRATRIATALGVAYRIPRLYYCVVRTQFKLAFGWFWGDSVSNALLSEEAKRIVANFSVPRLVGCEWEA